jgi:peptide/nickel transport system permease protein
MLLFLYRRLSLMLFTLIGVILLTFLLFNVVGGSPAKVILGEKASPQQLEEFEAARGLDRPLFYGYWVTTRALPDLDALQFSGLWEGMDVVEDEAFVQLQSGAEQVLPIVFSLDTNSTYRLEVEYRSESGSRLQFGSAAFGDLPAGSDWRLKQFRFQPFTQDFQLTLRPGEASVDLRSVRLRKLNPNPWDSQFRFYVQQILSFDFGRSHFTKQRVSDMLLEGIGPSLMLAIPILVIGLFTSIVLSLICAQYRDRLPDRLLVIFSVGLMSVNCLVWIVAGQYILAFKLNWFPVWGFESWAYLALPIGIGVFSGLGQDLRLYRTVMLDEMYRDYVRTAKAKGCSNTSILGKHVLKNAMIPIITNLSLVIPFLYTGSLLLESYFGIPGLGYLSINGIFNKDIDVVRAVVLIGSVLYMISNLVADILYAVIDPRVQLR